MARSDKLFVEGRQLQRGLALMAADGAAVFVDHVVSNDANACSTNSLPEAVTSSTKRWLLADFHAVVPNGDCLKQIAFLYTMLYGPREPVSQCRRDPV